MAASRKNFLTSILLILCTLLMFNALAPFEAYGDGLPNHQGKLLKKVTYSDKNGSHLLLLTHTGLYQSRTDPSMPDTIFSNGDIYAYDYLTRSTEAFSKDSPQSLLWQMHDYVHACEASATAEFAAQSPIVTDLDHNGVSEVWLVYYVGCRGDVSPDGMKILLYEGGKKYALRGETFVHVDGMDLGGTYTADPAFQGAPQAFKRFADQLWQQNRHH